VTWSYGGDPSVTTKDAVRFYLGDTNSQDQQLSDEEIAYLLSEENDNPIRAAARGAENVAAYYARQVSKSVGGLSLSAGFRMANYQKLAERLWRRASMATNGSLAVPYAGGISHADKDSREDNSDRVEPAFSRELHDIVSTNPTLGRFDD